MSGVGVVVRSQRQGAQAGLDEGAVALHAVAGQLHAEAVGDLVACRLAGIDQHLAKRVVALAHELGARGLTLHHKSVVGDNLGRLQAAVERALDRADLLILQFPLWWFGPPAILKGWFERVFTRGFGYMPGRKYDTGLMRGKRAMVSVTTGTSATVTPSSSTSRPGGSTSHSSSSTPAVPNCGCTTHC